MSLGVGASGNGVRRYVSSHWEPLPSPPFHTDLGLVDHRLVPGRLLPEPLLARGQVLVELDELPL